MKRILSICVLAFAAITTLCAQDIIVTKDAQKIEAKILEVSKSEIKYKDKDNLNGPTFILETAEISSIIYSNGKVVLYNQQTTAKEPANSEEKEQIAAQPEEKKEETVPKYSVDESTAEILLRTGETITVQITELKSDYVAYILNGKAYTTPATQIEKVTFVHNGQVKDYSKAVARISRTEVNSEEKESTSDNIFPKYISRTGNTYYYDGKAMNGSAYSSFLYSRCPIAYAQYKSGHTTATIGWVLMGLGLGMDIGFSWWVRYMWIPALGLELACIPTIAVGYSKMHKSANLFNSNCADKRPQAYWSINASKNSK